jgi:hypothetical protein
MADARNCEMKMIVRKEIFEKYANVVKVKVPKYEEIFFSSQWHVNFYMKLAYDIYKRTKYCLYVTNYRPGDNEKL